MKPVNMNFTKRLVLLTGDDEFDLNLNDCVINYSIYHLDTIHPLQHKKVINEIIKEIKYNVHRNAIIISNNMETFHHFCNIIMLSKINSFTSASKYKYELIDLNEIEAYEYLSEIEDFKELELTDYGYIVTWMNEDLNKSIENVFEIQCELESKLGS